MNRLFGLIAISLLALASCQKLPLPIVEGDLYAVSDGRAEYLEDTLIIAFNDNSWIYEDDYNMIKSNVLVYMNRELVDQARYCKTYSWPKGKDSPFICMYTPDQLKNLQSVYAKFPLVHDFAEHIVTHFDITEWYNFRDAVYVVDDTYKDGIASKPFELLSKYAVTGQDSLLDSKVYKRLSLIREMVVDMGLKDAWTDSIISADQFLEKYDYFFEKRGIRPTDK